jgi:hypothetical protein
MRQAQIPRRINTPDGIAGYQLTPRYGAAEVGNESAKEIPGRNDAKASRTGGRRD